MAHERVHFAGGDVEVDSGECLNARKVLRDAAHLEQRPSFRDQNPVDTSAAAFALVYVWSDTGTLGGTA